MTPVTILSSVLNCASHDAARAGPERALTRQMADLNLLAAMGFNAARTGNAAIEAHATAVECRDLLLAQIAALDVVIEAAAVEVAPNVVRFRGARG